MIYPHNDVFRVEGPSWSFESSTSTSDDAKKRVQVLWNGKDLDVCPQNGAKLIRFDAGLFGDATTDVTLCKGQKKTTPSEPPHPP